MVPSHKTIASALALAAGVSGCQIEWKACDETDFKAPLKCGNLDVPLDYTNPNSSKTLTLDLLKVPAESKSKGSILFNFGGPGQPNRQSMLDLVDTMMHLTGGQFDLVTFDSRGTVDTIPFVCTEDAGVAAVMGSEQVAGNTSDASLGRLWARGAVDAQICHDHAKENGSLISTAFVARDLISVVDALEEDGMLRYWGLSYGTVLGATVTSMFPERIDKIILDAVQNPHEYYHGLANPEQWTMSDKVFSAIFSECVDAGPKLCPLAARNKTAAQLEKATWDLIDEVKYRPIATGTGILDYTTLKGMVAKALYSSRQWSDLVSALDLLLFGPRDKFPDVGFSAADPDTAFWNVGIQCSDNMARAETLDDFLPIVEKLYETSRIMGDLMMGGYMRCSQWTIKPKEVYKGAFEARTKNPMLLIGNTYDGHTPIISAHNVSAGYEDSVVLEVNGYGHGSTAVPSICTMKTVSAYWNNGTLPEAGTVCQPDVKPYTGKWWSDLFKKMNASDA